MYDFGKLVKDSRESEAIGNILIERGDFDSFIDELSLDKEYLEENLIIQESYVFNIDEDVTLESYFDDNEVINSIKSEESTTREDGTIENEGSIIVSTAAVYFETVDKMILVNFIYSNTQSYTSSSDMLLLAVGLVYQTEDTITKKYVTVDSDIEIVIEEPEEAVEETLTEEEMDTLI